MDNDGGTDVDVGTRIGKARTAIRKLKKIWRSSAKGIKTKVLFISIVKTTPLMRQRHGEPTSLNETKTSRHDHLHMEDL